MKSPAILTVVVAMSCEAKPLIDALRLSKRTDKPFGLFVGQHKMNQVEVLVAGIGALSMATAVGWLGAQSSQTPRVWLNIGIAGHGSLGLGSAFRVHACTDILATRKIYPAMVATSNFMSDQILSVNTPSQDYPELGGVDMEAYAFFSAAHQFSSAELVESVKIVSDNPSHNVDQLTATAISDLMGGHTGELLTFANALLQLVPERRSPTSLVTPDVRATHSQRQQLNALLAKLDAVNSLEKELITQIETADSITDLLELLTVALDDVTPTITEMTV